MKAIALVLTFLALASVALGGCNNAAATTCQNTLDTCTTYGSSKIPTCECSLAFKNCMTTAGCCSTANTSDACDTECNSNCQSADCSWPPVLADACADRDVCLGIYQCTTANCACEVQLRQCLLARGCSYGSTLSSSCTSDCNSRTPSPACGAFAATPVPSPTSAACVPAAGYLPSGDCSCRDDIRNAVPSAVCASSAWTFTGDLTVSSEVLNLQYNRLTVDGDLVVSGTGIIAYTFDSNSDNGQLTVTGDATISNKITVEITNLDTTPKVITLLTAANVSVPNTGFSFVPPTAPNGYCFPYRIYTASATQIVFNYTISNNTVDCSAAPATPSAPTTSGVASRPPSLVYVPPQGTTASTLSIFASVVFIAASLATKLF